LNRHSNSGLREREIPQGCAEGPQGRDPSRPYPFAGSLGVFPKSAQSFVIAASPPAPGNDRLAGACMESAETHLCRGLGGVPQLHNPPESPFVKGGLRGIGARGLKESLEIGLAGFASLYPPYNWIPACAGMIRLRRTGAWGVPTSSFLSPKTGGQGG
jgi:hypothetical protein